MTYAQFKKLYMRTFWAMMSGRMEMIRVLANLSDNRPTWAEQVEDEIGLMTHRQFKITSANKTENEYKNLGYKNIDELFAK